MHTSAFADALRAIRSASALTEDGFLQAGTALETSTKILASLTASFEAVVTGLKGDNLTQALNALSETANSVTRLGENHAKESAALGRLQHLTETIEARISRMHACLKDIDCLTINSKIAAANINAPGADFSSFSNDIRRTMDIVKQTLNSFTAELHVMRQQVMTAHESQLAFATIRHNTASSISERLVNTTHSIASQHDRAARSGREVELMSGRIHQRICDAIMALQIGDITRQRLEHGESALQLAIATSAQKPSFDEVEQHGLAIAVHKLQSAQLSETARNFDRELRQIVGSLNSLATETRTLRSLGDLAYGASDRAEGTFIMELEGQVGEAIALFEGFEIAQTDAAHVTARVSEATVSLRGHLQRVKSLEEDIRIMGLNTTFKCARIGREGLALSVIAQELRAYANGFAKEAGGLEADVENVVGITDSLVSGTDARCAPLIGGGAGAMRDAHAMLRRVGESLDIAVADLERDGDRVVALLVSAVTELDAQNEVSRLVREAADDLTKQSPDGHVDFGDLPPRVNQMIEEMARGYTMANERAVHDRVLGRATVAPPLQAAAASASASASAELADLLF